MNLSKKGQIFIIILISLTIMFFFLIDINNIQIARADVPVSPTDFDTAMSHTTVTLTWSVVNGATGYDIEADGIVTDVGNNTTYKHSGLNPNTQHNYRVRAKNESGEGEWSETLNASTLTPIEAQIRIDGDDSDWNGITPVALGEGETINLSAVQDNEKVYMLIRGTNIGDWTDFYIDSDNDSTTGRHNSNWTNCGADYLVENGGLWHRENDSWVYITEIVRSKNSSAVEVAVELTQIGRTGPGEMRLSYDRDDANCAPVEGSKTAMIDIMITSGLIQVNGISVNKTSTAISIGSSQTLTATISPANATNQNVAWSSSDETVATVDVNGVVTGVSEGTATITVTTEDGGFTATCLVTVEEIIVDGNDQDWAGITPLVINSGGIDSLSAIQKDNKVYFLVKGTDLATSTTFYIDSDNNPATGFQPWMWDNDLGADYSFDNGNSYKYEGTWVYQGAGSLIRSNDTVEASIDLDKIGLSVPSTITVGFDAQGGYYTRELVVVSDDPSVIQVTNVSLDKATANINIGYTETLTATVTPSNASNKNVAWSSSDETVATVDVNGVVTGVSEGTATITVTTADGGFTATCTVTVAKIIIDGNDQDWTGIQELVSNDNGIDRVSAVQKGNKLYMLVKGTGLADTTTFNMDTDNNIETGFHFWVYPDLGMDYFCDEDRVYKFTGTSDEDYQIEYMGAAEIVKNGDIIEIAIDLDMIGLSAPGTIRMVFDDHNGHYTKSALIRWSEDPNVIWVTDVSLDRTEAGINIGDNVTLTAIVSPTNASNQNITWSSSDENVATVDEDGIVTGISEGMTTVTVTTLDGEYIATCEVTVSEILIDGNDQDWTDIQPLVTDSGGISRVSAIQKGNKLYILVKGTDLATASAIYLDTDNNATTGFHSWLWNDDLGTDYLCDNGHIYAASETTYGVLEIEYVGEAEIVKTDDTVEVAIDLDTIELSAHGTIRMGYDAQGGQYIRDLALIRWSEDPNVIWVTDVNLDKSTLIMMIEDNETLTATITPADATNQNITWSSSDGTIATVDENGVVTGVSEGTATITVTTEDGGYIATCEVGVSIPGTVTTTVDLSCNVGEEYLITAALQDIADFTGKEFMVSYDPVMLELIDFAAQTKAIDQTVGMINKTNIEIISYIDGVIRFRADKMIPENRVWSGTINIFKFRAISNGMTTLMLEMEEAE